MVYDIENGKNKNECEKQMWKKIAIRDIYPLKITNVFAIYYLLLFVICHPHVLLNN